MHPLKIKGQYLILLIIISLLNSFSLFAHEEPSKTLKEKEDKEEKRMFILKNKINSVTVWKNKLESGVPDIQSRTKYYTMFYDEKGNLSSIYVFTPTGLLEYRTEYTYDNDNNMISDTDYDIDGNIIEKSEFKYDSEGRVTEQFNYDSTGALDSRFTYTIDNENHQIIFIKYKPLDNIEYKIIYKYSGSVDSGNNIEIIKQKPGGELIMRVQNVFDSNNFRLKKIIYDENNRIMYYFQYEYYKDTKNFSSITKKSEQNKILMKSVYDYNENGLINNVVNYDENNAIITYMSYTYDYKEE